MDITEMCPEKICVFISFSLWEEVAAGIIVIIVIGTFTLGRKKIITWYNSHKIYNQLKAKTSDEATKQFKSTKEIAKETNIDENQVRSVCKRHKKIYAHSRKKDQWSIFGSEEKSVYEERGILEL